MEPSGPRTEGCFSIAASVKLALIISCCHRFALRLLTPHGALDPDPAIGRAERGQKGDNIGRLGCSRSPDLNPFIATEGDAHSASKAEPQPPRYTIFRGMKSGSRREG